MCQLFHGGREVITPARGRRPCRASLDPVRPVQDRAARAHAGRDRGDARRLPAGGAPTRARAASTASRCAPASATCPRSSSPRHANARTDEYGGSFENRLRFLREVLEAMREGFGPDGAVGCRLTDESGSSDGTDEDDVIEAAGAVARRGPGRLRLGRARRVVDLPRLDAGSCRRPPPRRNAIDGVRAAGAGRASTVPADRGRARARPRRGRPHDRRGRLRRRRHDAGDDRRPRPGAARRARGEPVTRLHRLQPGLHRPLPRRHPDRLHREPLDGLRAPGCPRPAPAARPRTVVVVGAGPAGCAAAAAAAACGHRVVVLERGDARRAARCGSRWARPGTPRSRAGCVDDRWPAGWRAADVRYGAEAGPDDVLALAPDRVVRRDRRRGPYLPAAGRRRRRGRPRLGRAGGRCGRRARRS